MQYHVTQMDRRHAYYSSFRYILEFSKSTWQGTGVLDFDRARRWMNKTWGWSQDVDTRQILLARQGDPANTAVQVEDINQNWAYSVQYKQYRIYLKDEQELNWFVLAHPNESNS
jgi:hypothetical protein